jgi:histidinol phosphatase-like PHP family hydrolase
MRCDDQAGQLLLGAEIDILSDGKLDYRDASQLEYVRYGVYVARRAWVQPQNVVNTWPWTKLQRWLRRERLVTAKASA